MFKVGLSTGFAIVLRIFPIVKKTFDNALGGISTTVTDKGIIPTTIVQFKIVTTFQKPTNERRHFRYVLTVKISNLFHATNQKYFRETETHLRKTPLKIASYIDSVTPYTI